MRLSGHRLAACLVMLALLVGSAGLCQGWLATPTARMACCTTGAACPMRAAADAKVSSSHHVSQSEADSCCASSERDGSAPSPSGFLTASPLALAVSPVVIVLDSLESSARQYRPVSVPLADVPRHLLLTVLQV